MWVKGCATRRSYLSTMMKSALILATLVGFAALAAAEPQPDASSPGWSPLLAADLSNTESPAGVWSLANGELSANADQCIWTKAEYENFLLDLEFKTAAGTNSGVLLYCTDTQNWIPHSVEVQILDQTAEKWAKTDPTWHSGGIFGHLAPLKPMTKKPGEWNRMTVEAKGKHLKVWLNGELTADMDMALWTSAKKNPNGTGIPDWLSTPVAELPNKGHIGLQGKHGDATVWFRKVQIKALGK